MNLSTNRTYDVVQIHHEGSLVAEMYGGSFEERVERGRVMASAPELADALAFLCAEVNNRCTLQRLQSYVAEIEPILDRARGEDGSI